MLCRPIPAAMRAEMDADPYYHRCAREAALGDHVCEPDPVTGKLIEWDHAMTYAGLRLNEIWALVPSCYLTHRGGMLNKEINQWLALNRATEADLAKYPRADWVKRKRYLNEKYGVPGLSTERAPF